MSLEIAQKSISSLSVPASGYRYAIVAARWNEAIVFRLITAATVQLQALGVRQDDIELFRCPGSYEIPLVVQACAESKSFDGVIALGCVIRGDTFHFELVAQGVADGLMRIMLDTGVPCIFGVLTTDTVEQALARAAEGHDNKGYEAAQAAVEMTQVLRTIRS